MKKEGREGRREERRKEKREEGKSEEEISSTKFPVTTDYGYLKRVVPENFFKNISFIYF